MSTLNEMLQAVDDAWDDVLQESYGTPVYGRTTPVRRQEDAMGTLDELGQAAKKAWETKRDRLIEYHGSVRSLRQAIEAVVEAALARERARAALKEAEAAYDLADDAYGAAYENEYGETP